MLTYACNPRIYHPRLLFLCFIWFSFPLIGLNVEVQQWRGRVVERNNTFFHYFHSCTGWELEISAKEKKKVIGSSVCTWSVLSRDLPLNQIMVSNFCWNLSPTNYRRGRLTRGQNHRQSPQLSQITKCPWIIKKEKKSLCECDSRHTPKKNWASALD